MVRPSIWYWSNIEMAFCASSSVAISTKAKPRAWPVARSLTTLADSTFPAPLNISSNFESVISKGRFPTYSFLFIVTPQIEKRFTNDANSPYCAISVLVRRIGADGLRDKPSSNSYLSFVQQIAAAVHPREPPITNGLSTVFHVFPALLVFDQGFTYQLNHAVAVRKEHTSPLGQPHLRKVDAAKQQSREDQDSSFVKWPAPQFLERGGQCRRVVGTAPRLVNLSLRLFDADVFGRESHSERMEVQPVLWPGKTPFSKQALVQRSCRVRCEQPEDGKAGRPGLHHIDSAPCDTGAVAIHAEDEGSDGINPAGGKPIQDLGIIRRLVETLVDLLQVFFIDRFQTDEDPAAATRRDQIEKLFVLQQIHADLRHPRQDRAPRDDFSQQGFGAPDVDREIVVDNKDSDLSLFATGARLEHQHFVDHALVAAKANRIAEETGDRAKVTPVWTPAARLHRNHIQTFPTHAGTLQNVSNPRRQFSDEIELRQIDPIPRYCRIVCQRRFDLLAHRVDRRIDFT